MNKKCLLLVTCVCCQIIAFATDELPAKKQHKEIVTGSDFTFDDDDDADIVPDNREQEPDCIASTAQDSSSDDAIFTLQGRRVKEITMPGVYIVNGKKRIVK